jgi:hypothetical protein
MLKAVLRSCYDARKRFASRTAPSAISFFRPMANR